MNKEFVYLSDDTFGVSDENGNITKQEFNKDNLQQWDIENTNEIIEKIINTLNKLNNDKVEYKSLATVSKYMFLVQIILLIGSIIAALIPALAGSMHIIVSGFSIFSIFWKSVEKYAKKKVNGLTFEIEKAEKIKKDYEQQLDNIKSNSKEITKDDFILNDVVKIESGSIQYSDIEEDLTKAYNEGYNKKGNSLVKKRKKHK